MNTQPSSPSGTESNINTPFSNSVEPQQGKVSEKQNSGQKYLWFYVPLAVTIITFIIIQVWIQKGCNALPADSRGECAGNALELLIVPLYLIAGFISGIVALIGTVLLVRFRSHQRHNLSS
jgi:hypothetical protein